MQRPPPQLTAGVAARIAGLGSDGDAWVAGLPALLDEVERRWSVSVGESLAGGTAAFVATARRVDGSPAVVKVAPPWPDTDFTREVSTLAAADGIGYVLLLEHAPDLDTVLLEALGPALPRCGFSPERQLDTLCDVLAGAWQAPVAFGQGAGLAHDKATVLDELARRLWTDLDRPCPEPIVDRAMTYAARRAAAFDPERCLFIHGDAAAANALRVLTRRTGAEPGFVMVDPDGFIGDPAYDLGVMLRDWCPQLLTGGRTVAQDYCLRVADRTRVPAQEIWEWAFLERVSTGLYALSLGLDDLARPMLTTAGLLL